MEMPSKPWLKRARVFCVVCPYFDVYFGKGKHEGRLFHALVARVELFLLLLTVFFLGELPNDDVDVWWTASSTMAYTRGQSSSSDDLCAPLFIVWANPGVGKHSHLFPSVNGKHVLPGAIFSLVDENLSVVISHNRKTHKENMILPSIHARVAFECTACGTRNAAIKASKDGLLIKTIFGDLGEESGCIKCGTQITRDVLESRCHLSHHMTFSSVARRKKGRIKR